MCRTVVGAAFTLLLALSPDGIAAAQTLPPIAAPAADPAAASTPADGVGSGGTAGRYNLTLVPGATVGSTVHLPYVLMVDTMTGRTWVLSPVQGGGPQTMIWATVPFLSPTGTTATSTPR